MPGYGVVFTEIGSRHPDHSLLIERLSEEHATARVLDHPPAGSAHLKTGDLVRVLPNHSCVVSNLVDVVWIEREGEIVGELPVAARGRIT
jgi:D-serine deaminase-like pyridoxal phosphate-dependent protein